MLDFRNILAQKVHTALQSHLRPGNIVTQASIHWA